MSGIKLPDTIKMIITDFDGVVTDNCVYINEDYTMTRKLNFKDVMGFSILKKNGFNIAIISGETNSAIEILAKKFDIKEVHQKIRIKIDILKSIIEKYNLSQEEYVYIGDDINDELVLRAVGIGACPKDAQARITSLPCIICLNRCGGQGAVREFADYLLQNTNQN